MKRNNDEQKKRIHIQVCGLLCNDFLAIIRYEFEKIHALYPRLQVESMVPCNCDICKESNEPEMFKYSELLNRIKHGRETIDCSKNKYCYVRIRPLITKFSEIKASEQNEIYSNKSNNIIGDEITYRGTKFLNVNSGIQNISEDLMKTSNLVNELKFIIKKENLQEEIKEEIRAVIEQIEDNDYELRPKAKIRLKDQLKRILQYTGNVFDVAATIVKLINWL